MTDPSGSGVGRYLFAATRGLPDGALVGTGIRGARLDVVEHAGLQGVVCDVALEEFGEEALKRNLEDLGWLEEIARAHNDVVVAVAAVGTVAPMRLVTIYADDASVARGLADSAESLTIALDRVQGRREWSVKLYAEAKDTQPVAPESAEAAPTSGRAYLERKRQLAVQRRSAGERSIAVAEEVHETLAGHVVASRRLAPQDPRLTGRADPMVLNGAYLVADDEGENFRDLVGRVGQAHPGFTLEAEGPWPPYTFATTEP